MKGIIFNLFEELVRRDYGDETWDALLVAAGVEGAYTSLGSYPDAELGLLFESAAGELAREPTEVVHWLGRESIPLMHGRYPELFAAYADTRALVLALNDIIHPEVRKLYPGAITPDFEIEEDTPEGLRMRYASPRRMCAFAEGLIEGAALHFGENVAVRQTACMHRDDPACVFELRFEASPAPADSPAS